MIAPQPRLPLWVAAVVTQGLETNQKRWGLLVADHDATDDPHLRHARTPAHDTRGFSGTQFVTAVTPCPSRTLAFELGGTKVVFPIPRSNSWRRVTSVPWNTVTTASSMTRAPNELRFSSTMGTCSPHRNDVKSAKLRAWTHKTCGRVWGGGGGGGMTAAATGSSSNDSNNLPPRPTQIRGHCCPQRRIET